MASAQVLPSSRKQEHLEAGKRRLEEFRRKKASERAKKTASNNHTADAGVHDKQPAEVEQGRLRDSDGADTSNGVGSSVSKPSAVKNDNIKTTDLVRQNELANYHENHAGPPFAAHSFADTGQIYNEDKEFKGHDTPGFSASVSYSHLEKENKDDFGIYSSALGRQAVWDDNSFSKHSYPLVDERPPTNSSQLKDFSLINPDAYTVGTNVSSKSSGSTLLQNAHDYVEPLVSGHSFSSSEDYVHHVASTGDSKFEDGKKVHGIVESNNSPVPDEEENTAAGRWTNVTGPSPWLSNSLSTGSRFDVRSPSNNESLYSSIAGTNIKRSRLSFLDSINITKVPSASVPFIEAEMVDAKVYPMDVQVSDSRGTVNSSVAADDPFRPNINGYMEREHNFYSRKQDEDFAALEQHIEDLTQEKFSLQRTLEASRTLAESLAAENSALTDSYNKQGSVVNQLKLDMERFQNEIKAQLVELESVKIEYANAQLECNAADERAKLLASEVIGLEEKALRLRSNELKLEKQLEKSQAEFSLLRKKLSSLERERQDLQSTIDALQEEKKLLQSKLRKASTSGKVVDVNKSPSNRRDRSTSTEDLVDEDETDTVLHASNPETLDSALRGSDASTSSLPPESGLFNPEALLLTIPPEQTRTLQNINSLISELALEKEELMQALSAESSQSSKLKELNKELSRKLEAQTQRLELLTAQSMAHDIVPARQPDSRSLNDNAPYADEGDEVVERVLGWIMKLFPGGPSRRRTSKLL